MEYDYVILVKSFQMVLIYGCSLGFLLALIKSLL